MVLSETDKKQFYERIRTAFYGLAVCDALGGPLEFTKRRHNPNEYVRDMEPNTNFNLPAGHFTDDTSMALCLATSLAAIEPQDNGANDDDVDQAARYVRWLDEGYMSSVPGDAFDVGNQTSQALQYWRRKPALETLDFIKKKFNEEWRGGNGSLMRVLPCALVAQDEDEVYDLARRSSAVTHPHVACVDACALYSLLVFRALRGATRDQLASDIAAIVREVEGSLPEDNYMKGGPDGQVKLRLESYADLQSWKQKKRDEISSSGYVVDSLEAALWAFFTTKSFEQGAIEVVNLGDDADTVGAIYGGLAGAYYGNRSSIPARWLEKMQRLDIIEKAVDDILLIHDRGQAACEESRRQRDESFSDQPNIQ